MPAVDVGLDTESMLGDVVGEHEKSLFRSMGYQLDGRDSETLFPPDPDFEQAFENEFDEVDEIKSDGSNEGQRHALYLVSAPTDRMNRGCHDAMARQAEAFSDSLERR